MKIQYFCWNIFNGKIEIFTFSGWWKSGNVATEKAKCLYSWNFNHNSHLPHLSAKRKFLKIRQIRLKIQHFCWDILKGEIEIFTYSGCRKSGNVASAKAKCLCTWNCQHQQPPSTSLSQKNVFENLLNTFEDITFLPGSCKGKNWNFYIFWMLKKL